MEPSESIRKPPSRLASALERLDAALLRQKAATEALSQATALLLAQSAASEADRLRHDAVCAPPTHPAS